MSKQNIADTYSNLETAFKLISDNFKKNLPVFTKDQFLGVLEPEFQEQLSKAEKDLFATILQEHFLTPSLDINGMSSINKEFQKDYEAILKTFITNFSKTFDMDESVISAQSALQEKLAITKREWLANLNQKLSNSGQTITPKLETAFTKIFDKNFNELCQHLEKFKNLPAVYTKYQLHSDLKAKEAKSDKDVSHTFDIIPGLEELQTEPKTEPVFGLKVHKDNTKQQILSDIASGKESLELNVIAPDRYTLFKKMAEIGFQTRSQGLALLHIIIFTFTACIFDDEKRVVKAIKQAIQEKQLFGLDPNKITLEMTNPSTNTEKKGRVIRKKGPLSAKHINELQSMIDEIKNKLQEHHHLQKPINKKPGSPARTATTAYNTIAEDEEDDVQQHSSPRGP